MTGADAALGIPGTPSPAASRGGAVGASPGLRALVIGGGVAGLTTATELAARGWCVSLVERGDAPGPQSCSWWAGGMLAPGCEREAAEEAVVTLGAGAADWWDRHAGGVTRNGTLVLALGRDRAELSRFARRAGPHETLDRSGVAALEPDLGERFAGGLFFPDEAHLDPRSALAALVRGLRAQGAELRFGTEATPADEAAADAVFDCRGLAARPALPELRGVKGEMLVLRTREVSLSRPVRLLHPRHPLYIVPRGDGVFMLGATQIESDDRGRITARAMLELLGAAYALHPAFGEAEVLETGADARPAFPDNLPRVTREGRRVFVNGLFRHGFLLGPAMARQAADTGAALAGRHAAAAGA